MTLTHLRFTHRWLHWEEFNDLQVIDRSKAFYFIYLFLIFFSGEWAGDNSTFMPCNFSPTQEKILLVSTSANYWGTSGVTSSRARQQRVSRRATVSLSISVSL